MTNSEEKKGHTNPRNSSLIGLDFQILGSDFSKIYEKEKSSRLENTKAKQQTDQTGPLSGIKIENPPTPVWNTERDKFIQEMEFVKHPEESEELLQQIRKIKELLENQEEISPDTPPAHTDARRDEAK